MPVKTVSMLRYMGFSVLIVAVCAFLIIVFVGSESFGQDFNVGELALVLITLLCIITALALSYLAFTKVVQGDMESQKHFPEWDRAMERWNGLRYCSRDDVVFDPQTNKVLSEEALSSLLSSEVKKQSVSQQSTAH